MRDDGVRRAGAFAPAHVTGIFRPATVARDPRARGSLGAGIVLDVGVTAAATFDPAGPRRTSVLGDRTGPLPISTEVAQRLRPAGRGTLSVRLAHALPIGQGFGSSAAGATATALAVGSIFHRTRRESLAVAHLADLFGGGGLGGVASIVGGGGVEFRVRPGLPPWGRVLHRPLAGTVIVGVVGGPLPSPGILGREATLARIALAAEELPSLLRAPDVERFFASSERFTDRAGLCPASLGRVLRALRARGAWAAQAMFGRSFFARPRSDAHRRPILDWLEGAGVRALEVRAASAGAGVRPGAAPPFAQPF